MAECGDDGEPIVHKYPDSPIAKAYLTLAGTVSQQIANIKPPADLPGLQL